MVFPKKHFLFTFKYKCINMHEIYIIESFLLLTAVQNERQPRNTATVKVSWFFIIFPPSAVSMEGFNLFIFKAGIFERTRINESFSRAQQSRWNFWTTIYIFVYALTSSVRFTVTARIGLTILTSQSTYSFFSSPNTF